MRAYNDVGRYGRLRREDLEYTRRNHNPLSLGRALRMLQASDLSLLHSAYGLARTFCQDADRTALSLQRRQTALAAQVVRVAVTGRPEL